jgi:hypothetical protein
VCTTALTPNTPPGTPLCTPTLLPAMTAGGSAAYLFANVTNDDQFLGVSWSLSCVSPTPVSSGSVNTACGTTSPAQTISGPVPSYPLTGVVTAYNPPPAVPKGGTVIITAHATSLPSVVSSVTLTITAAQGRTETNAPGMRSVPKPDALLIADSATRAAALVTRARN